MSDTGYGDFEFERRFLVQDLPTDLLEETPALIVQAYFLAQDGFALRMRVQASVPHGAVDLTLDERALLEAHLDEFDFCALTAKGPMIEGTRYEAEREIDPTIGIEMVRRGAALVAKTRHAVWLGGDGWVVDVFGGANRPLVVAEVERGGPVTDLTIPTFCVTELTDDPRFSNDGLARAPFSGWAQAYGSELAAQGPRFLQGLGRNHVGGEQGPMP